MKKIMMIIVSLVFLVASSGTVSATDLEASFTEEYGLGCAVSSDQDLTIFGKIVLVGNMVNRDLIGTINDPPMTTYWQYPYWPWYPPEGIWHPTGYFIRTETIVPDEIYRIIVEGDHKGSYPGVAGYVQINDPFYVAEAEREEPEGAITGIDNGRITFNRGRGGCPYCGACDGGRINISVIVKRSIIPATIDIDLDTLNLKGHRMMHHGKWITAYIELPESYNVEDIDIDSVTLTKINDDLLDPPLYTVGPSEIGDYDDDGIPDLMVKFDRQELIPLLEVGDAELTVSGELIDGPQFEGTDTISVIDKCGK